MNNINRSLKNSTFGKSKISETQRFAQMQCNYHGGCFVSIMNSP
jgi:hypothetical protein